MNHSELTMARLARLNVAVNRKEILGAAVDFREAWRFGAVRAEGAAPRWHVWIAVPCYQPDARRVEVVDAPPQEFDAHGTDLLAAILTAINAAILDRQSRISGCNAADDALPLPVWGQQRAKYDKSHVALRQVSEEIRALEVTR